MISKELWENNKDMFFEALDRFMIKNAFESMVAEVVQGNIKDLEHIIEPHKGLKIKLNVSMKVIIE